MIKKYNTAAVYIHQDEYSEPIPVKLSALEDVAASNNLTIIKKYIDKNSFCNPFERPEMKRLLKDAVHNKFNTVLIYETADIARCDSKTSSFVFDIRMLGVNIKFVNEFCLTMEGIRWTEEIMKRMTKEEIGKRQIKGHGKAVQLKRIKGKGRH